MTATRPPAFPVARLVALAWLAVFIPTYWVYWGPVVFLNLCDIAVVVTCIGLWTGSPLLLSSQALSSLVVDLAWLADLLGRATTGHHFLGGTEYMWDPEYPPWVRGLSLFHAVLPVILLRALRRVGYDGRGFGLQAAIAAVALVVSRALGPRTNANFAFIDPVLGRSFGPAPVHLLVMLAGLTAIYWATGRVLRRVMPPALGGQRPGVASEA